MIIKIMQYRSISYETVLSLICYYGNYSPDLPVLQITLKHNQRPEKSLDGNIIAYILNLLKSMIVFNSQRFATTRVIRVTRGVTRL